MIGLPEIWEAQRTLRDFVYHTPTYFSNIYSRLAGARIYLKLECYQPIRVFKIRGAYNKIRHLTETERDKGVVTASSGNHGLAVAYVAKHFGIEATVCVPETAILDKIQSIKDCDAELVKYGESYEEAYAKALKIQKESGAAFVHPYADPLVIAGQGTVGLELIEDIADLDTVFVPVGGGGLIAGIAIAVKSLRPDAKVIGVQPEGASAVYQSLKADRIVTIDKIETIADGLAGRTTKEPTFGLIKKYVDDILIVDDDQIKNALVSLLRETHILAEPAGVTPLAALMYKYRPRSGEKIALTISGGNISVSFLQELLLSQG